MFHITAFGSLVEKRIKAKEEEHVDHKKRDYPNDNGDHYLKTNKYCQVCIIIIFK